MLYHSRILYWAKISNWTEPVKGYGILKSTWTLCLKHHYDKNRIGVCNHCTLDNHQNIITNVRQTVRIGIKPKFSWKIHLSSWSLGMGLCTSVNWDKLRWGKRTENSLAAFANESGNKTYHISYCRTMLGVLLMVWKLRSKHKKTICCRSVNVGKLCLVRHM